MIKLSTASLSTLGKLTPIASAVLLSACGGTGQDVGTTKPFQQTFQGVAIDGYLARSLVFIDYDNNGTRDPWEPSAFTDNDGYYSYNPKTNTNYCAPGTAESETIYCLVSTRPLADAVIRIDGGYDVITGEPFVGQLSRRQTIDSEDSTVHSVISPLTSLFTNVRDDSDRTSILASMEIEERELDVDYFNADGSGALDTKLLNTALKVHKVVSVLSDRVTDTYTEIGSALGTPNDMSATVYSNLASVLSRSNSNLTDTLSDTNNLREIVLATESTVKRIYAERDFDITYLGNSGTNLSTLERVVENAANLPTIIDRLINPSDSSIDNTNIIGRTRAIESVVIKNLQETSNDSSIDNAVAFFHNELNGSLIDTLINSLSQESSDLSQLVHNDFSGDDFDDEQDINDASQLPQGTEAFNGLAGMQLRVSDLDLGWGPDNLKDSEVEAYFHGTEGATDGSFDACVKYIDGANINGSLGEANTRGELVSGYWSLLSANSNGSSYSMLLTITFLGSTYQAIMKPVGSDVIDGMVKTKYRFDYGDEIRTWYSDTGVITQGEVPTSNKDCEELLPSRWGLY